MKKQAELSRPIRFTAPLLITRSGALNSTMMLFLGRGVLESFDVVMPDDKEFSLMQVGERYDT
jgi:hypothetical protein